MGKRFVYVDRKLKKRKRLFFFVMFIFGIYFSFKLLDHSNLKIDDKKLVQLLLDKSISFSENEESIIDKIFLKIKKVYKEPVKLLISEQSDLIERESDNQVIEKVNKEVKEDSSEQEPLIYIYNTHQSEGYAASSFLEYSVNPTVMMNDYILEDIFEKNGLPTLVEERKIKDILAENGWKYSYSYMASRKLMEDVKSNNPSLKYFIDVHRDSLTKNKTTITIGDKDYAKTIFLIGIENPKYDENLIFTTKLNDKLNQKYPGLSKGIYKKGGPGVNGVYNQDFSPYTILIEVGGYENTTTEVLNSMLAFSECFMEVINENES